SMRSCVLLASLAVCLAAWGQPRPAGDDDESALLVADARARLAAGDYDRAAAALDRALAVNPRRIDAYLLRAGIHAVKKQYALGLALMRRARGLAPDNIEVLAALGTQLALGGNADEAVPLLERVAREDRKAYQAHAMLGRYYAAHGRPGDAAAELGAYLAS